jgi:transcriptional regulator with XRE-family HTH domain
MSTYAIAPTVGGMSGDEGARIRERRTRIGISVKALAERADVDRGRLSAIEDGAPARDSTVGKIHRVLGELEHEMGLDVPLPPGVSRIGDPGQGLVEFVVEGNFGVRAVVKGPVSDIEALQKAAAELIAGMNRAETDENP